MLTGDSGSIKKIDIMKTSAIEKDFEIIGRMMEEDYVYLDPEIGFVGACRIIGADSCIMNKYCRRTFGLEGAELFRAFRTSYRRRLYNKYRRGVVIE